MRPIPPITMVELPPSSGIALRRTARLVVTGLSFLAAVVVSASNCAKAQSCCASPPTSQSTTAEQQDQKQNELTATQFTVTVSGGVGQFGGWTLGETEGQSGADSCWGPNADPQYVPEYPSVTGTTTTVTSSNTFTDRVGWLQGSVNYIRTNNPTASNTPTVPYFPCGEQMYQQLWIECPGSTTPVYWTSSDTVLSATVYATYVINCRQGWCPTINQ